MFPIAGLTERQAIPRPSEQQDVTKHGFVKPDLTVFETNATGMINLVLIAVQAFRRQEKKPELGGMRGKSKRGLHWESTIIATAAKYGRQLSSCLPLAASTLSMACRSTLHRSMPW